MTFCKTIPRICYLGVFLQDILMFIITTKLFLL